MLSREEFIRVSLEINLFFQRIMKEHMFFIITHLQPVNSEYILEANILKKSFEDLLSESVIYAKGVISEKTIESNEFVTPYTLRAEEVTSSLTGTSINTNITKAEMELSGSSNGNYGEWLENIVCNLNSRSYNLLEEVIKFKRKILRLNLECKVFAGLYPEMQKHLIEEAELYLEILMNLMERRLPKKALCEELNFWNHIMGEHAEFIDGLLDPSEKDLKESAEEFVKLFEMLVEECLKTSENQIVLKSLEATVNIRNFKRSATEGLLECKIKSIISPLLADHVLREANHYIRLLNMMKK